jgi:hypothetical protein
MVTAREELRQINTKEVGFDILNSTYLRKEYVCATARD